MAESVVLAVTGMKCGGCEANVTTQLGAVNGVISVAASSKDSEVKVEFDPSLTSLDTIIDTITAAGFEVGS